MAGASPGHKIRFAAFEVDTLSGELRKRGMRIKLQDQPLKILLALLEKPGEIVTREELRERIWGKDTFVDFDHGLSAAVNRLREALGDSAENPRFVETLARRGYRFIVPVEGVPKAAVPPPPGPRRTQRRLVWAALAVIAAAAVALGFWLVHRASIPPPRLVRLTEFPGVASRPSLSRMALRWLLTGMGTGRRTLISTS